MQRVTLDIKASRRRLLNGGVGKVPWLKAYAHSRFRAEARRQCRRAAQGYEVDAYDQVKPLTGWDVD